MQTVILRGMCRKEMENSAFWIFTTGKQNGPASPEATGPEVVDKMDAQAVTDYFNTYLICIKMFSGKHGLNGLDYLVTDSYKLNRKLGHGR